MPQIFLEYKPLSEEDEFIGFWNAFRQENIKESYITDAELFKIREGLFLGSIAYSSEHHKMVHLLYGDTNKDEGNMQSVCKNIHLKYTARKL
ncbi:MAG: hypothetical protein RL754_1172 [Bacteroidota bacterium]|jgi:hypothetical protein